MPDVPGSIGWQHTLAQAWRRRGLLAWLLWPLSLIYRLLVTSRRLLYQGGLLASARLPIPIVVVGNVVAGGAGKTPVVIALAEHLQQRGVRVGIISRGYGRNTRGCLEVTRERSAQEVGDEPALIHRRTGAPVFVATQRVQAAWALLTTYPETQIILSDDGLQHLGLQRDLEIGVFDDRGVGNGFLLPAGPLREAWPRPLDLLLHTGACPAFGGFQGQRQLATAAVRADGTSVLLDSTVTGPTLALAAIAQPETFFAMLHARGVRLDATLGLPDHYSFDSWSRNHYKGYTLICTEKDAVKLWQHAPQALAVPLYFSLPQAFWQGFDARIDTLLDPNGQGKTLSLRHGHTTT